LFIKKNSNYLKCAKIGLVKHLINLRTIIASKIIFIDYLR